MASDATYEPPGLATLRTIALTSSALVADRSAAVTVSAPALLAASGWRRLLPRWIGPVTCTSATVSGGDAVTRDESCANLDRR